MTPLVFDFPGYAPPPMNGPKGLMRISGRWAGRERQKMNADADIYVASAISQLGKFKVTPPVHLHCVYLYCGVPRDWMNMGAGFKFLEDAIVRAGVLPDDSPRYVVEVSFGQIRVKTRKEVGCQIEIHERPLM